MSFDVTPFQQMLALLGRDEPIIRIGHQRPGQNFFQDPVPVGNLQTKIENLVKDGRNVWFEVNPSSHTARDGRTAANEVTALRAVWADLDYKGAGLGNEATCMDVIDDLSRAVGADPAVIVSTGGGLQPYWLIEGGDITPENFGAVQATLRRWGLLVKKFAADHGGTADSVFDLPRILRVPGTENHKYNPAEPVTVFFPGSTTSWSVDELNEILDDWGIVDVDTSATGEIVSPEAEWEWADADCQFVQTLHDRITDAKPSARHQWGLAQAAVLYGMIRGGCVTEQSFYMLRDLLGAKIIELATTVEPKRAATPKEINDMFIFGLRQAQQWSKPKLGDELNGHIHSSFEEEIAASQAARNETSPTPPTTVSTLPPAPTTGIGNDASSLGPTSSVGIPAGVATVSSIFDGMPLAVAPPSAAPVTATIGQLALAPQTDPDRARRMQVAALTDVGNSERLGRALHGTHIHVPGLGWHVWDDGRYKIDTQGLVTERAKDTMAAFIATAGTDVARKWGVRSMSRGGLSAAVALAESLPELSIPASRIDAMPYELCVPGGVVDLSDGTIRPADPKIDFHTLQTSVAPDWSCPTPRFTAFLRWALDEQDRIDYVQRLFGIAAIGTNEHQVFPIFLGPGANGKSTITAIMIRVFGEYAAQMPQKFLIEKHGSDHPTEIAQLRGLRLAVSSEVPPNAKFNEELVKTLTGEETLRGRLMGKDFFSFPNTTTHVMTANHLPSVTVGGRGFWRRLRRLDFRHIIPDEQQDLQLVNHIVREEAPGIMAWIIDGAKRALEIGEQPPASVKASTQQYRFEEDALARFVNSDLVIDAAFSVDRATVYTRYKIWCMAEGVETLDRVKFEREMQLQQPGSIRDDMPTQFFGLSLPNWRDELRDDE